MAEVGYFQNIPVLHQPPLQNCKAEHDQLDAVAVAVVEEVAAAEEEEIHFGTDASAAVVAAALSIVFLIFVGFLCFFFEEPGFCQLPSIVKLGNLACTRQLGIVIRQSAFYLA